MEIIEIFENFDELLREFLLNAGVLAPLFSSILIILEGTLAFLPLFVFVTINIMTLDLMTSEVLGSSIGGFLGPIAGGTISWICTVIGSFIAFKLFRIGFNSKIQKKAKKNAKLKKFMRKVEKIKFSNLVFIISIPFAPSFFINVAAGLSNINKTKYFYALLLGKIGVIIFCGFLGVNLIECLTNPYAIIKIVIVVATVYLLSRYVNKKFDLDGRF